MLNRDFGAASCQIRDDFDRKNPFSKKLHTKYKEKRTKTATCKKPLSEVLLGREERNFRIYDQNLWAF